MNPFEACHSPACPMGNTLGFESRDHLFEQRCRNHRTFLFGHITAPWIDGQRVWLLFQRPRSCNPQKVCAMSRPRPSLSNTSRHLCLKDRASKPEIANPRHAERMPTFRRRNHRSLLCDHVTDRVARLTKRCIQNPKVAA